MGIAATTFTTARTPENFKAWFAEAPADAQTYLKTVAVKTGNVAALTGLDALEKTPDADPAAAITNLYTQVDAAALAATQAAREVTLGWSANGAPKEPPALSGKLTMEGGLPTLATAIGTFTLKCVNPVGANDVTAFNGRVVTVKGWPDATWAPGAQTKPSLLVEEFGPGTGGFVTGRVKVLNAEVFINVRADKQVHVTEPGLKAALLGYDQLGIVLPGEPELVGTEYQYKVAPEGYYVLGGFNTAGTPNLMPDKAVFNLQLAHGKSITCEVPRASWDATARTQRHYVYGRFEGTQFKGAGITPTAGSWSGPPSWQRGAETTKFIEYATPVGPSPYTPDESKFGV